MTNIPQWRPSIFSSHLPYILAEIDQQCNFTGIYDGIETTGNRDYYYFLSMDVPGFSEYFRYRYPAAQGTFVTSQNHQEVDQKITYKYIDPASPIYDIYLLGNLLLPQYSCFVMLQNTNDAAFWAACLKMASQILLPESNNFISILPNNKEFAEKIYALSQDIFGQVTLLRPIFSSNIWLIGQGVSINRQEALRKIDNVKEVTMENFPRKVLPEVQQGKEHEQIILSIRWRIPGPLDLRYQPTCPTSIRLRRDIIRQ